MALNNEILFRQKGNTCIVEINRPEKRNAMNTPAWQQLREAIQRVENQPEIRSLIVTGSGTSMFSAGVDVSLEDPFMEAMIQALESNDRTGIASLFASIHETLHRLAALPVPTIAALNGDCYSGGLELALACDIRVARQNAVMAFQETRLGLIPDLGGTVRLARLVGPARAKDLVFSCRKFNASEALAMGLVQHVFPDANFIDAVAAYAETFTDNSPRAIEGSKKVIDAASLLPEDALFRFETREAVDVILSRQCIEGIGAFFEKRSPRWIRRPHNGPLGTE